MDGTSRFRFRHLGRFSDGTGHILSAGSIALFLGIVFPLAYFLNIWVDEAYTLEATRGDMGSTLRQALDFEMQAPLYFLCLNLWRSLSPSLFVARLFSVLCLFGVLVLGRPLVRRYLPGVEPSWFVPALALNSFTIWAALEIRIYAFALFWSAVLLVGFHDAYLSAGNRRGARIFFPAYATLALYSQYYLGFLLAGFFLALLATRKTHLVFRYLKDMLLVGLLFSPLFAVVPRQLSGHSPAVAESLSLAAGAQALLLRIQDYILPIWFLHPEHRFPVRILFFCFVVLLIRTGWDRLEKRHTVLGCILAGTTLLFLPLFDLTGSELMMRKHTYPLFLPSLLGFYSLFSLVPHRWRGRVVAVWLVVFGFMTGADLVRTYRPMAKTGDYRRAADFVMEHEKPDQPILLFNAEAAIPFRYYYRGVNRVIALPQEEDFRKYDPREFVVRSVDQLEARLQDSRAWGKDAWFLTNGWCRYLGVDYHCGLLDRFLEEHYSQEARKNLFRMQIRFLRWTHSGPEKRNPESSQTKDSNDDGTD